MIQMQRFALVLLLVAACKSANQQVPEGRIDTKVHPDFDRFRPVQVAVLPVDAPTFTLRQDVRRNTYDLLVGRKYSPFKLQAIDARMTSDGKFEPGGLDWDASLAVNMTRWKPVKGTRYWVGDGVASLTHKTGEVIWSCAFDNYAFSVKSEAGQVDESESAAQIAALLLKRLPLCPQLKR